MKKFALVFALMMLPTAAMAQDHGQHHGKTGTAAKPAAEHMNFAKELIAATADLKLTSEQIAKLEVLSARMDEMHKQMAAHHGTGHAGGHGDMPKMENKMHADLLAVFTEEQLVKVRPLMKAHMEKCEHMMKAGKTGEQHKH